MNVLVVDDTPDCREPLARFLRLAGYNATAVAGGVEALAHLHDHPTDLILLDLMMPEMDGITFLRILRENETWRDIPVIVVTALSDGPLLRKASDLGAKRSLLKSRFSGDDLLANIQEVCPSSL